MRGRQLELEEYMQGVHQVDVRGADVEELWQSRVDIEQEMDVAAVGS